VNEPDATHCEAETIRLGQGFVRSEAFKALFQEGMELIEDTASYLDGPGREESRHLPPQAGLAYATQSMRLTTRLMQVASWLMLQRAVAEGEITPDQAGAERSRVRLSSEALATVASGHEALPSRLRELIGLGTRLHARIIHLDQLISQAEPATLSRPENPVAAQLGLLERAFGPAE
jgi:regulator of CtrA degradation